MSTDAQREVVVDGRARTIEYADTGKGSKPAKAFIEGLDVRDKASILALFKKMADSGSIPNREQFKKVEGEIFEFKKHQIRVFCFRVGQIWYLTNGYRKKKDRLDRAEVDKALRIMSGHRQRARPTRKGQS